MSFLEWIKEIFRKKEFYQIDYEDLNSYSIEFREISDTIIQDIKKVILNFKNAKIIEDQQNELFEKDALIFNDINELAKNIESITNQDFKKTYFEALKEGWDFNYFLTNGSSIYKNTLLISNKISSSNEDKGVIMYSLLAIKKYGNFFYLWNLLDEYDSLDE